jgi:hypothetical protein
MITVETLNENYIKKTGQKAPTYLTDKWEWQDIVWKKVEFEANVFSKLLPRKEFLICKSVFIKPPKLVN